jgi:hypothetical protein
MSVRVYLLVDSGDGLDESLVRGRELELAEQTAADSAGCGTAEADLK